MWSGRKGSTPITSGVSPVFATPTKTDTKEPWGMEGIAKIKAFSRHPLVAIGGLNASNAEAVVMAGADGVAVVSAICASPDPLAASRELAEIIDAALEKRKRDHVKRHDPCSCDDLAKVVMSVESRGPFVPGPSGIRSRCAGMT